MVYMSKRKYDTQMERIRRNNISKERKRKLREERMKYWPKFILPSTSKIMLGISAFLCLEVLIFCQYMIVITGDTNALYTMVGALFSFMGIVLGYYVKSTRENVKNGITFETTMAQIQSETVNESIEAVG